ncbi:Uncharacterised protein [Campylobacter sputorum subsp. bubulus]|uniref:DUF596 domain-containing protein n=1 Tax=Campylobacter sputorum subsp. sputorum TaxID=32024 RepID=A0A381DHG0_9BACT|nr:hypothetical protein [Campylobacter sputorum]ASM35180.1 hypothetical protein CSPUT_0967 [Campylobacter sputorum aubsp. sputorum RM3237]KAB0581013.1 hypothetical protein F7P64_07800 [Campylobacter sputorum subsp. sputorum]QEL05369.1 hypothetical protein CSPT_0964 [Campylobacter sputorum subsp. sputorum]SUX08822.1 Uncharacterised protein [Campylobacter sputorum subsp. bubulus]SUX10011.1 Uncharacterised protein [Campylobacter sputorum subsp. sputorum]
MEQNSNSNKLLINSKMFSDEQIEEIYDWAFSNWVSSLYGWGKELFAKDLGRKITYEEEAEIFLALFKRMIDDGLILAHSPIKDEPEKELQGDQFWDVSSDKMIEYIRSEFPSDLKYLNGADDENDEWGKSEWGKFWYGNCPHIRWVDKDTGQIY